MEDYSSDDNGVYTANYSYQWAGRHYSYIKRFFSEQPTPTVDLCWDPATPSMAKEREDLEYDKTAAIKYTAIMTVLAGIFGFLNYHIAVLISGIIICGLMMIHNKGMRVILIGIVCFIGLFFMMGKWTFSYSGSYAHQRYEELCVSIKHLDDHTPAEVLDIYDRWYWTREDFDEYASKAHIPFICQFADTYYLDKECPEWPEDYYKYTNWEFRENLREELRYADT